MKEELFKALLLHVPFDGWSDSALRRASKDVGIDFRLAKEYFPDGLSMIDHHHWLTDLAMVVPTDGDTTSRVKAAILSRLDYVEKDRESVRRALQFVSLPQHVYAATKISYRSADAIWEAVGSQDVGFDWFTKRTTLIAVYGATLLFWLSQAGNNRDQVEAFLDRQLVRLVSVMKPFGRAKASIRRAFS